GQFLTLAEKQGATVPLMIGNRMMGTTHAFTGEIAEARAHYNRSLALYDPAKHRPLATRFGHDTRVTVLSFQSLVLWLLGYPEAAVADTDHALRDAREIGQAATLMHALAHASFIHIFCGKYATANALLDELTVLAAEKGAFYSKVVGMIHQGCVLALTGEASDAVQMLTSGITAFRSTGATRWMPLYLSCLARAYAELGQFDD